MTSLAYVMHATGSMKALHENDPDYLDGKYWAKMGWLGKTRPWKA